MKKLITKKVGLGLIGLFFACVTYLKRNPRGESNGAECGEFFKGDSRQAKMAVGNAQNKNSKQYRRGGEQKGTQCEIQQFRRYGLTV